MVPIEFGVSSSIRKSESLSCPSTHSRWRIGNLFMMIPEKRQRFYERLMKKENLKRIRKIEKIETEECYQYDNYVTTKITLNY